MGGIFFYYRRVVTKKLNCCVIQLKQENKGGKMKTFYIDVYFLVNFTVDLLSIHLALRLTKVSSTFSRVLIASVFGASLSILELFFISSALGSLILNLCFLTALCIFAPRSCRFFIRIRFCFFFFIVESLFGGLVYLYYATLDKYLKDRLAGFVGGTENRKALIFSIIILFSNGVIRLMMFLFSSSSSEKTAKLRVKIGNRYVESDALIDSGNLVTDPMNMNPVLFIKPSLAKDLLPREVVELCGIDELDREYKKRIRLIPITRFGQTHVMTGIRPDSVTVVSGEKERAVELTVAIDKEGGTYGGYEMLAPAAALENVF